jgi:hypothetical protein
MGNCIKAKKSMDEENTQNREVSSEHVSINKRIMSLTVAEKVKLAMLGNKEVRSILIKDPNKLVSTAVLKNPKISDSEIIDTVQSRNTSEEVLRIISNHRSWTRNYQVKCGLVNNPKTPTATALKFINYLMLKDLKNLVKNKNVPNIISTAAKNALQKKSR